MDRAEKKFQEFKQGQQLVEEAESTKTAVLLQLEERNATYQELEGQLNNTQMENDSLKASLQHLEGENKANQMCYPSSCPCGSYCLESREQSPIPWH